MRKGMFIHILFGFFILSGNVYANDYDVSKINPDLKKNAYSVVRVDEKIFTIKSYEKAELDVKYAITVFKKNGDEYANFAQGYDKIRKIAGLEIRIFDEAGELIKKVKRSEIKDMSAISGYSLYEDNRVKVYKPLVNSYPYTIEYSYSLIYNGTLHYPSWQPINVYDQSIENSSLKVIVPDEFDIRYLESNLSNKLSKKVEGGKKSYQWVVTDVKAIEYEPYSPYLYEFTPKVYLAPTKFEVEDFKGDLSSWKSFGDWINSLNSGLGGLSEVFRQKVKDLVAEEENEVEKIKILYKFLQSKTRYVSIQLGIGGWRPFAPSTVEEYSYGDCKALSYFMHEMLEVIGVKSFYTLVKSGNDRNMNIDFPRNQFNHIIVCVPQKKDTLWLECTSQTNPFGYLSDFTDDRNVLLITPEGGKIAHTKAYSLEDNTQFRKAIVEIDENGAAKANIITDYRGIQYKSLNTVLNLSKEEQRKKLNKDLDFSNFSINSFEARQQKDIIPRAQLQLDISLSKYAKVSGKRLVIPLNLLNRYTSVPDEVENRNTNVVLKTSYYDCDTIVYKVPKGLSIEYKPKDVEVKSPFGEYKSSVVQMDEMIVYIRSLKMKKGIYAKELYPQFVNFYKKIVKADKSKILLKKEI